MGRDGKGYGGAEGKGRERGGTKQLVGHSILLSPQISIHKQLQPEQSLHYMQNVVVRSIFIFLKIEIYFQVCFMVHKHLLR